MGFHDFYPCITTHLRSNVQNIRLILASDENLQPQPQGSRAHTVHESDISRFVAMQHAKILCCGPP